MDGTDAESFALAFSHRGSGLMGVPSDQVDHCNEIRLVGRVAAEPRVTVLPSGDELVGVRLVVERPPDVLARSRRASVDTIACVAWTPLERRRLRQFGPDDVVEVSGALRRRFWRSSGGLRNRYEVEVGRAARLVDASYQQEHRSGRGGQPGSSAEVVDMSAASRR